MALAFGAGAQLPNGFSGKYSLTGSYDSNDNEIDNGAQCCYYLCE